MCATTTSAKDDSGHRVPLPRSFIATAQRLGNATAYFGRSEAHWQATSWLQFLEQVRAAARALIALGVAPGVRVGILGFNRPEWLIMDHAAMMVGAIGVGIYWTSAAPEVEYVLNHSQACLVLLEDATQLAKLSARRDALPWLRYRVSMQRSPDPEVISWEDFLQLGRSSEAPGLERELERRIEALSLEDLGTLIYTSGTTGMPKAVMLTHANLAWVADTVVKMLGTGSGDRHLSYLPMAHIAERVASVYLPARAGNVVYFARSIEQLLEDLKDVRPTVFFGVPRVWEKMRAGLEGKLAAARGAKQRLLRWSMQVARAFHEADLEGRPPGVWRRVQMAVARRLVLEKVRKALGLDASRMLFSGAAPIAVDHLRFFLGLDLVVRELYGQSEDSGPTTVNMPGSTRIGSVGKALPGLELRIAPDGEILVRAPSVFAGYLADPDDTAEAKRDGWLYSGDLGRLDAQGYLFITGRKKDLIITSGGKNISPAALESDLSACELIEHAVVVGEGRRFLCALVTLKAPALDTLAARYALSSEGLHQNPRVLAAVQAQIDEVNARHARVAGIRKFAVIAEGFDIGSGYLTATMKLRRQAVIEAHRGLIEEMYRENV